MDKIHRGKNVQLLDKAYKRSKLVDDVLVMVVRVPMEKYGNVWEIVIVLGYIVEIPRTLLRS